MGGQAGKKRSHAGAKPQRKSNSLHTTRKMSIYLVCSEGSKLKLIFIFNSMFNVGRSMLDVHLFHYPASCTLHLASCTLYPASCILHHVSCIQYYTHIISSLKAGSAFIPSQTSMRVSGKTSFPPRLMITS